MYVLKFIVFRPFGCIVLTILKKDVVNKFSLQVYRTRVYMVTKFLNNVIIHFKIAAIKINF